MHAIINWFIRNPVAANIVMFLILFAGAVSLWGIRIEGFPKIPPDTIEVSVVYIGASAEQTDQSVTRSLEQALEGLPGAEKISSLSIQEQSIVYIKKTDAYSLDRLIEDVKQRIDNITTLPASTERPIVRRAEFNIPAMIVQVYGNVPQKELQKAAGMIKERLLSRAEIPKINQWGEHAYEVSIEVKPETLQAYDITLDDLAQILRTETLEYRTGELKTRGGRIQLRADQLARETLEFRNIPVFNNANGSVVHLGDIATIKDGFKDDDILVTFNGEPAIGFEINIDVKGNLLDVNQAVNEVLQASQDVLGNSIHTDVWANQSEFVSDRLSLLSNNAWQGLLLVFIILTLFLDSKLAFWVALGVPVCVAGTLAVINSTYLEYSLNDITTFGMIIVFGILVDDAVVIGESVYTERKHHKNPIKGTEIGVSKVAVATIFGVLTTVAAFYPLTTLQDSLGKVFGSFAVVVIVALLFSLFESKFILPSHLASTRLSNTSSPISRIQAWFNQCLDIFVTRYYKPLLSFCLRFRWQTLTLFVTVVLFFLGLASNGIVRTVFFPDIPGNIITVKMEMDSRAPYQLNVENTQRIVSAADEINRQLMQTHSLEEPPISKIMMATLSTYSTEIYAELVSPQRRPVTTLEVLELWREQVGQLEATQKLNFSGTEDTGGGFGLEVYSKDDAELKKAIDAITDKLSLMDGVYDVRSDLQSSKPELRLRLKPEAIALGLDVQYLSSQIGDAYGGIEVQRFLLSMDEIKVYLRYPDQARASLHDLLQNPIRLPNGNWVSLLTVAEIESNYVPQWIWRRSFQRAATLSAFIDKSVTTSVQVYNTLKNSVIDELQHNNPGVKIAPVGDIAEEGQLSKQLWKALIIALVLIYALLAIPLKSYIQPLVIASVIPLGFVGAVMGHMLMDIPLSILSFFGMLALAGVVVNDSLVLVTHFNQLKNNRSENAVIEAAASRVRAIFLTTATTVIGLTPIMLETSEQAQYLIPAAVSIAFGELFATIITLIVVPLLLSFQVSKKGSEELDSLIKPHCDAPQKCKAG